MVVGKLWFKATDELNKFELNLSIDKTDYTDNLPIRISSQNFYLDRPYNFTLYYRISEDEEWIHCPSASVSDIQSSSSYFYYYLDVYKNGDYYFKFVNNETDEEIFETVKISNIIYTQDNVNNYVDGVFKPTPFLNVDYISDTEILVTTQKFTLAEISKLKCFYAKDITDLNDESLWNRVDLHIYQNEFGGLENFYQFALRIKNDDGNGDGTYFFKFYNKETEEETGPTSLTVMFDEIVKNRLQYEQKKTSKSLLDIIKDFFKWIFNFFGSLLDFFVHIFVPTDEQWADLDKQDIAFKGQIESKFPFFYWFQDELEKADEYVYSDDFLKIEFPSWQMDLGIIKYQTPDISFTAVRDAYAPYRLTIRNSLFIIAVALAIVYLIKYFLNYSVTGSANLIFGNSANVSSSDSWKIDGQTSLFGRDKK